MAFNTFNINTNNMVQRNLNSFNSKLYSYENKPRVQPSIVSDNSTHYDALINFKFKFSKFENNFRLSIIITRPVLCSYLLSVAHLDAIQAQECYVINTYPFRYFTYNSLKRNYEIEVLYGVQHNGLPRFRGKLKKKKNGTLYEKINKLLIERI